MQVNNTSLNAAQLPGAGAAPQATAAQDAAPADPVTSEASAYTPSAELAQLTALAQQQPEVRPDRVAEVAARLSRGDYGTPQSTLRTAEAILNAGD